MFEVANKVVTKPRGALPSARRGTRKWVSAFRRRILNLVGTAVAKVPELALRSGIQREHGGAGLIPVHCSIPSEGGAECDGEIEKSCSARRNACSTDSVAEDPCRQSKISARKANFLKSR